MTDAPTPQPRQGASNRAWIAFGFLFATVVVLIIAGIALPLGGGGGDDGTPTPVPLIKGRAVVRMDVAPPVSTEVSTAVQTVLKARLDAAGVTSTITLASDEQISIDFESPHAVNFITDLVVTPGVRFKTPLLDGTAIKCKDTSGNEFSIEPELLRLSGNLPVCVGSDDRRAEVEWKPAVAQIDGVDKELSGAMFVTGQVAIPTNEAGSPVLNADFNEEGKAVLQAVTKDLIGYPLGVFFGDSLLMAPKIQREIQNGRITLAGANLDVMLELSAVIKGGEFPIAISLVSIGEQ